MTDFPQRPADAPPFFATMREQILATPLPDRPSMTRGRRALARLSLSRHRRRVALGLLSGVTAVAAAVVAVAVLVLGATTSAPPAYALTRHADGSITITLNDLTKGIPALNAKLKRLRIPETVIPIRTGCHSPDGSGDIVMRPDPLFEYKHSVAMTYRTGEGHGPPKGWHYVLAAKRLPDGTFLAFIGALKPPIPTCLPYSSATAP